MLFNNVLIDRITVYIHFLVFITSLFNNNLYLHYVEMQLRFIKSGAKFLRRRRHCFVGNRFRKLRVQVHSNAFWQTYRPILCIPTSVSLCKHLHRYNLFFISSTNLVNAPFRSSFFFNNEYRGIFLSRYLFRLFRYVLQIYLRLRNRQEFKKLVFTYVYIFTLYFCSYIIIRYLSKRQKFFF